MIKATELRIGNKVFTDTERDNPIVTVLELLGTYAKTSHKDYPCDVVKASIPYDRLHPIPLTPEIVGKCGFTLDDSENDAVIYYGKDRDRFELHTTLNGGDGYEWRLMYYGPYRVFEFLHDLQNVFFALTREELPVNLNQP